MNGFGCQKIDEHLGLNTVPYTEIFTIPNSPSNPNADILIRVSTECTWLNIENVNNFLPMIDYEDLFCYFFNTGRELP
ncbi:MAG: hypothetical protein ACM31H_05135 [Nitrososphaerales archaeon]